MNRIVKLTESDIQRITEKVLRERGYNLREDFASDMKKNMQAGAKQSNINATKCPLNYKPVSPQEIAKYKNSTSPPPWRDTRSGDHGYMTLKNGIICRSDRRENLEAKPTVTIGQMVEAAREGMGSFAGIAIQVLLEFLEPVGPAFNLGAWSLLALYDIIKAINTWKPNWINIIVDLVGVLTTGMGAPAVKAGLSKLTRFATGKINVFVEAIANYAPKMYKYLKPILSTISSIGGKILTRINGIIEVIGRKMNGSSLYNSLVKLTKSIGNAKIMLKEIEIAFGVGVVKAAHFGVDVAKDYAKEKVAHGFAHSVAGDPHHQIKPGVKPKQGVKPKPTGYIATNKIKPTVRPMV